MRACGKENRPLPPCTDGRTGLWYRLVFERWSEYEFPTLIDRDAPLCTNQEDPPITQGDQYIVDFEPEKACWRPAGERDGRRPLEMSFRSPLTRGGRTTPFPGIPACQPADFLARLLMKGKDAQAPNQAMLIGADSLIPQGWEEPSDKDLGVHEANARRDLGAKGLCRQKIATGPDRFGLFAAFPGEGIKSLRRKRLSNDPEEAVRTARAACDALPAAMRACGSSDQFLAEFAALTKAFLDEQREASLLVRDPYAELVTAPVVAEAIQVKIPVFMDENSFALLTSVATFGLSHGLMPDDLFSIADRISVTGNVDDFLYRFFALAALEVARNLHAANRERSGRDFGFDALFDDIAPAIADGRISVRVRNALDQVTVPNAFAQYDPVKNEIVFPPIDVAPPELFFEAIIHELTHAFQDMKRRTLTSLEVEEETHTQGVVAAALLEKPGYPLVDPVPTASSALLREISEKEERRMLLCMGYSEEIIRRSQRETAEGKTRWTAWRTAMAAHATGGGESRDLSTLFRDYHQMGNYHAATSYLMSGLFVAVGARADRGLLGDARGRMEAAIERAETDFDALLAAPPKSPQGAQAASAYASHMAEATALAFYVDRDVWIHLTSKLQDRADVVGAALLYQVRTYDGI